ncbi:ABC transporter permease [Solicola sp. PLA-1-18]|uniref:ABC transporter permease n=1 Tax=Solicola sp. PLA-1-18 TaxID=3380532 RepID=UPI003B7C7AF8
MSTAVEQEAPVARKEQPPTEPRPDRRLPGRGLALGALVAAWVVVGIVLNGRQTLTVARSDLSPFATWVNDLRDTIDAARGDNPVLVVLDGLATGLNTVITTLQGWLSDAPAGRPVPEIGWLGVIAIAVWIVLVVSGWRLAILCALVFGAFGTFGYWQESIDTLIVTFVSVAIVLVLGIPLGLWMGNSRRATAVVTPVLDLLQTLPSLVYLLPITLVFGIGGAPSVIATLIYALPPVVRITAQGIRAVSPGTLEAAESLGTSRGQRLRGVQLPMARRTIIVGINQSIMAALSMVTIAAFINSPGLGVPVVTALSSLDVGTAFTAGVLVALLAILLDRATTAAGERTRLVRTAQQVRQRRIGLLVALVVVGVCVYLSRLYLDLAQFPSSPDLGGPVSTGAQAVADWANDNGSWLTQPISSGFTNAVLNPFQALVADTPWWATAVLLVLAPLLVAGWRSGVVALVCVGVILGVGVWHEAMVTLATALTATVIVIVISLVLGVLMANSRRTDLVLRPLLDAAQTIPPFVYLVPALALFGPTRFTAIVAAVVYGAPIAIKLICDGIQGVAPTTVEAARSVGSSRMQIITQVQLPMARSSVALAANQGLLYVFAVIVIGGFVGAGGLGYLVVAGFSQTELFGKGVAAGIAITALAVLFDRMTQGWVSRVDPQESTTKENA